MTITLKHLVKEMLMGTKTQQDSHRSLSNDSRIFSVPKHSKSLLSPSFGTEQQSNSQSKIQGSEGSRLFILDQSQEKTVVVGSMLPVCFDFFISVCKELLSYR